MSVSSTFSSLGSFIWHSFSSLFVNKNCFLIISTLAIQNIFGKKKKKPNNLLEKIFVTRKMRACFDISSDNHNSILFLFFTNCFTNLIEIFVLRYFPSRTNLIKRTIISANRKHFGSCYSVCTVTCTQCISFIPLRFSWFFLLMKWEKHICRWKAEKNLLIKQEN